MKEKHLTWWRSILVAIVLLTGLCGDAVAASETLTVFAAASTTNAVSEIGDIFTRHHRLRILPSFASSSTLAKQIENGAPADIYISASMEWMGYLEKEQMIEKGTRIELLSNRIVLIVPADSNVAQVRIAQNVNLLDIIGEGRIAIGDPDHVPAGIYARQALDTFGAWTTIKSHVARSKDVRAALTLVERGECPIGLVYATDAAMTEKVKVVATLPQTSHPPIIYPVAVVAGKQSPATDRFMTLLRSPEARAVFEKYGFVVR